jgi:hypothetical protein
VNNLDSRNYLTNIFKTIEEFIANLSDEEYKLLIQNKCTISITRIPNFNKPISKNAKDSNIATTPKLLSKNPCNEILSFINNLMKCENLDEAYNLFSETAFLKKDLLFISKKLNVHILSKDKKEVIIKKIIESTVASKLSSNAIANLDLSVKSK